MAKGRGFRRRQARRQARRDARLARIQARKAPKLARIEAKKESGFWSPEAIAERQQTVREGIGAGAALAQTAAELGVAAATGGVSELGGLLGGGEEYDEGGGGMANLPSWALPVGIAALVVVLLVVVVSMSGNKKKAA